MKEFPKNILLYDLQYFEERVKKTIQNFECSPLKSKSRMFDFYEKEIPKFEEELKVKRESLRGFNSWCFFFGLASFHLFTLFRKKVLLYEMEKDALLHMFKCVLFGIGSGYTFGYWISANFKVYFKYRAINKELKYFKEKFRENYIDQYKQQQ